jgi:glycosyltransferase involved in cell wall biosynthesis
MAERALDAQPGSGRTTRQPPTPTRVGIVYPVDPQGTMLGGIESFIRGIIRYAPEDIRIEVIGVTTDPSVRKVGAWTQQALGNVAYGHLPVCELTAAGRQPLVPMAVRFMASLLPHVSRLCGRFDVLEFHRLEPLALFIRDQTPKTAVLHQNMDVIRTDASDIRWRYLPGLYFLLERALVNRVASAFFVRSDAVESYRRRYPHMENRFRFTPTWVESEIFNPLPTAAREQLRTRLLGPLGVQPDDRVLITVGRLDRQKDPLLLMAAFAELCRGRPNLRLVFVGDGVLRAETEDAARRLGIADRVIFAGLKPPAEVAGYLNASDLFVLSSAYEGMPISLLEAMACGLPACSTDVGEVRRVVTDGVNGRIVAERTASSLARGLADCLDRLEYYRGEPALSGARPFTPEKVLGPLYENYRRLARAAG